MSFPFPKIEYGDGIPTVITFDFEPVNVGSEAFSINPQVKQSVSLSGVTQTVTQFIEKQRVINMSWVSETILAQLQDFVTNWAGQGKPFKYYEDKNSASFQTYRCIVPMKFNPTYVAPVGVSQYIYKLALSVRQVVGGNEANCMIVNLPNNQSSAADITGLLFDITTRTKQVFCEVYRATDTTEISFNGSFCVRWKTSTTSWEISQLEGSFDDPGVTLSITTDGKVQCVTSDMSGSDYEGYIEFKEVDLC